MLNPHLAAIPGEKCGQVPHAMGLLAAGGKRNNLPEIIHLAPFSMKASDLGVGKPYNAAVLRVLLDAGVNYIDTAESYGRGQSETVIGEVIKGRNRKSLFITSRLSNFFACPRFPVPVSLPFPSSCFLKHKWPCHPPV